MLSHAEEQYAISSASQVEVATIDDKQDFQLNTALLTNRQYAIVLFRLGLASAKLLSAHDQI